MHDVNAGRAAETFVPLTASAVLVNPVGLYARPSVKLTQCAKGFVAKIEFALAADRTTPMLAIRGRASFLGERSIGHMDPGSRSASLLIGAAVAILEFEANT